MVAAAVLLISACGSTVQWSNTIAEGGPGGDFADDGLSIPSDRGANSSDRGANTRAKHFGDSRSALNSQTATAGSASGRSPTAEALPPGASGRGFTAKKVLIGYVIVQNADDVSRSFGGEGYGDQKAVAEAMAKNVNARGGLAGRKIVLVVHEAKVSEGLNAPQIACDALTQDRPVFAVVNVVIGVSGTGGELAECLAQRKTLLIGTVGSAWQAQLSRLAPYWYSVDTPTFDRYVPVWIRRAEALGYFGGWDSTLGQPANEPVRIGISSIAVMKGPDFTRLVRREVERRGFTVASTFEYSGDWTNWFNQGPSAVAKFQSAGVTHIIGQEGEIAATATAAEGQRYRPRYAINTMQSLKDLAPPEQFRGSLGIGWMPVWDIENANHRPGDVSAAQSRCRKIMQEAGQDTSNRSAALLQIWACDGFNFLFATINRGGLSPQGIRDGANAMGAMRSASVFGLSFAKGRFDGVAAVRDLGWREDCGDGDGCFGYLGRKNRGM